PSFTLTAPPPLPLRRWRLPITVGSRPARGGHPCDRRRRPCWRSCPRVVAPCGLAAVPVGGRPLWAMAPTGGRPLQGGLGHSRLPLAGSQVMASSRCRGPGHGQPPLHADSMHVVAPPPQAVPTSAVNRCNKRVEQFYAI
ncbi:hypothetical protein GW17_00037082, partial [Ensete ventricosum]